MKGRAVFRHWHGKGWTMSDDYKFGIEEEFFLVDAETKSVARDMPTGGDGIGAAAEVCCWAITAVAARHTSKRTSVVLLMADLTRD